MKTYVFYVKTAKARIETFTEKYASRKQAMARADEICRKLCAQVTVCKQAFYYTARP